MKLFQKGFTLIELMIAIAIVAILASIALPAYLDYTTRAKVSEGLVILDGAKLKLEEEFYTNGWIDPARMDATLLQTDKLGKYVDAASWLLDTASATSGTTVQVRYSSGVAPVLNKCLGLVASINGGDSGANLGTPTLLGNNQGTAKITWVCKSPATGSIVYKYLPSNCRNAPGTVPVAVPVAGLVCA